MIKAFSRDEDEGHFLDDLRRCAFQCENFVGRRISTGIAGETGPICSVN